PALLVLHAREADLARPPQRPPQPREPVLARRRRLLRADEVDRVLEEQPVRLLARIALDPPARRVRDALPDPRRDKGHRVRDRGVPVDPPQVDGVPRAGAVEARPRRPALVGAEVVVPPAPRDPLPR